LGKNDNAILLNDMTTGIPTMNARFGLNLNFKDVVDHADFHLPTTTITARAPKANEIRKQLPSFIRYNKQQYHLILNCMKNR
jgi:hypothetical protein